MNIKLKKSVCLVLIIVTIFSVSLNAFAWGSSKHESIINSIGDSFFIIGEKSDSSIHRNFVAEAARLTDEGNMSAIVNDPNNSPYHAKSEYTFEEVKSHAKFIHSLAKNCLLEKDLPKASSYTGVKKRIVSDLNNLMSEFTNLTSNHDKGYVILGVYLHLVQDIYAHRTKITYDMVANSNNVNYINKSNFKSSAKRTELLNILGANKKTGSIPMIRLKDFLLSEIGGKDNRAVYEDNKDFMLERYDNAVKITENQIRNILVYQEAPNYNLYIKSLKAFK